MKIFRLRQTIEFAARIVERIQFQKSSINASYLDTVRSIKVMQYLNLKNQFVFPRTPMIKRHLFSFTLICKLFNMHKTYNCMISFMSEAVFKEKHITSQNMP